MNKRSNEKYSQQLIDAVAELLPEIRKFYESDEGKAFLEEWNKDKTRSEE